MIGAWNGLRLSTIGADAAEGDDTTDNTGLFDALQKQYPEVESTRADGLKFNFERSWVHLRASNTEPIVRIIAEAPTSEQAEQLAEEFARALP